MIATQIRCSRAGIWLFEQAQDGLALRCLGIFDRVTNRTTLAPNESGAQAARYFEALKRTGQVVAPEARTHPATEGFFRKSLEGNGVESLLATSFALNGELFGAFTCTEVGRTRQWNSAQLLLLKRISSRASLSLAGASRVSLLTIPAPL